MVVTYRTFPEGWVGDQVADVCAAMTWTFEHCMEFNGNPDKVIIMGHSAGAHLSCVAMMQRSKYVLPRLSYERLTTLIRVLEICQWLVYCGCPLFRRYACVVHLRGGCISPQSALSSVSGQCLLKAWRFRYLLTPLAISLRQKSEAATAGALHRLCGRVRH